MIKVAIFDVDGTLFDNENRCVHSSTIEAIEKLKKQGVTIVIATGRSFSRLIDGVLDFVPDYVVAFSGHALVDDKGNYLYKKALAKEDIKKIDDFALANKIAMTYKTGGLRYTNEYLPDKYMEDPKRHTYVIEEVVYQRNRAHLDMEVFFVAGRMDEIQGKVLTDAMPWLHFYFMHSGWVDITHKDIDKSKTTEMLLDHLGVKWSECIAFGDGLNDIQIIEKAGIGVCMGNGYQETKAIADIIADPIDQDGIYKTLVNLKLICSSIN